MRYKKRKIVKLQERGERSEDRLVNRFPSTEIFREIWENVDSLFYGMIDPCFPGISQPHFHETHFSRLLNKIKFPGNPYDGSNFIEVTGIGRE